jgi:predicted transcriptional regulator
MINRIILNGLEERANELNEEGLSQTKIAAILSREAGIKITQMSVSRYFQAKRKEHTNGIKEAVNNSEELQEKAARQYIDVNKELMFFLNDIKDAITECKTKDVSPEKRARLYGAALKNLEIVSKRLGEIDERPVQVMINVTKVSQEQSI